MAITHDKDVSPLHAAERRAQIVQQVAEDGKVLLADLVKRYNITGASARRDLMLLEADHRLKRVHGGAISVPGNSRTDTFVEKAKMHIQAKESTGKAAVGLMVAS